ncbi:MAG: YaeQ family protein [Gammaproteobacteria bacterium]|nr:YaeQ family protein [Gammaproteobacteria bacterium]
MAAKATIFKADLQVVDMDRNYYREHSLTLARHPSETDERMMLRILAFARHASDTLTFTRGLSSSDEPDLWQKDLTGVIEHWIELGQPDEKRLRKACGRSQQVLVYCYSGNSAGIWWQQNSAALAHIKNLAVLNIPAEKSKALAQLAQRNMQLQATIQDGDIWIADSKSSVEVTPGIWQ